MIPGAGPNGVYPNQSLGLPIPRSAKSATIKIFPRKLANVRLQPRKTMKLNKYPVS